MRGFKANLVPPYMESDISGELNQDKVRHLVAHLSYEGLQMWAAFGITTANRLHLSPQEMLATMEEYFSATKP